MLYKALFSSNPRLEDPSEAADMVRDPNCGVYVPKNQSVTRLVQGKKHYFCSKKCADEYPLKKS